MPIFEFVCAECGKPFEELVLGSSKVAEVTCPACHSPKVTNKISTFASRLSGEAPPPSVPATAAQVAAWAAPDLNYKQHFSPFAMFNSTKDLR